MPMHVRQSSTDSDRCGPTGPARRSLPSSIIEPIAEPAQRTRTLVAAALLLATLATTLVSCRASDDSVRLGAAGRETPGTPSTSTTVAADPDARDDAATRAAAVVASATAPVAAEPMPEPAERLVAVEPWDFEGRRGSVEGELIETLHFRIHTTLDGGFLRRSIATFQEAALDHYVSGIVDLPMPTQPIDTFIYEEREDWQHDTRRRLPGEAGTYLALGKGGYTTEGAAVLYDIGRWDTLVITAHEGWHQYAQTVFRHPLPIFLDEGVATYMEGFRMDRQGDTPSFRPWRNFERFGELRSVVRKDELWSLRELLTGSPQSALRRGRGELLSYYAQVWALTHFLAEGAGGRYREGLEQVLLDAVEGRIASTVLQDPDARRLGFVSRRGVRGSGLAIAVTYFDADLERMEREFHAFTREITRRGAGNSIWRGRSPVSTSDD